MLIGLLEGCRLVAAWTIPTSLPLEPLSIFHFPKLNSGVLSGQSMGIFYYSNCSTLPSHMYHPQLCIILNTWILTIEAILLLAACS